MLIATIPIEITDFMHLVELYKGTEGMQYFWFGSERSLNIKNIDYVSISLELKSYA